MKRKILIASVISLALAGSALAQATVPTEISDITTNATTVWTTVKGIVIGVVGFGILVAFVKRLKSR